ncbi:hypothetical protein ABNF97_10840 [Plantactinospora sp. B6F1]|uniref:hypothetical protein n=1 Tax=Plantactinospora sp. B6F1 TaxID=3158971 RepID=UPI001A924F68
MCFERVVLARDCRHHPFGFIAGWVSADGLGISKGLIVVGGVVCIVASAGACTVVAGAALVGGVLVDGYKNDWDLSEMNWRGHITDAAFIIAGAGLARAAAGSGRAYLRDTPWKFNPGLAEKMPTRTTVMGNAVRARAPISVINAGYVTDDVIHSIPALSYASTRSKQLINTFDPVATLPALSGNANMWAATNGPDRW